jgi:RNA polymerase sigma factor (sigma-70 family)
MSSAAADVRTVFVVDDDASVRDSIALLLSLRGYRTAVFAKAEDFLQAWRPEWSGCVLTDIRMPGKSGLELQTELAAQGVGLPVVFLTAHGDVASARQAFRNAAVDFLVKPYDEVQLCAAIDAAFEREQMRLDALEQRRLHQARIAGLSAREREVMALMVRGLNHRDIGERLGISPRTVEVHKARVMAKLEANNLAELIRISSASSAP